MLLLFVGRKSFFSILTEEAEEGKPLLEGGLFAGQDYYDLRQKCLDSGSLFVDPMFPPCQVQIKILRYGHYTVKVFIFHFSGFNLRRQ